MAARNLKQGSTAPLIAALVALALSLAIMTPLCIALWSADRLSPFEAKAIAIAFFVLAIPVLVLLHELGHLFAAVVQGWRVPILCVGALSLRFSPLRFRSGRPAFTGAAGAIVAVPPDGPVSRLGWAAISAGGPAANLLVAAFAAYVALQAPSDSTPYAMFLAVAAISLFSGLYNLTPTRGHDGQHILLSLFGPDPSLRASYVRLAGEQIAGKRPRDWDPALLRSVEAASLWNGDTQAAMLLYAVYLDRDELAKARAALSRPLARNTPSALVEQAFLLAAFDEKPEQARALLANSRAMDALRHAPAYWRAQAAIAAAAHDTHGLAEALRKWRRVCDDWVFTTQDEHDWMDRVRTAGVLAKAAAQ